MILIIIEEKFYTCRSDRAFKEIFLWRQTSQHRNGQKMLVKNRSLEEIQEFTSLTLEEINALLDKK